jgi:2-isopropylmalate synthase
MSTDNIIVFDTTLRDGEQSPGCSMNTPEKLEVARALVELGVDVIEAGFPIASPGDFEAVQLIAREFGDRSKICGLARCIKADIDRAWDALKDAENARLHVFLATSSIHREFKLKMDKGQIVDTAVEMVKRAAGYCQDVEFSPEDAARTELDFLCEVVEKAIDAGATTVNIPDTVGYATPSHFEKVITHLKKNVSNIDKAVISCHCHNDLGLAVANSLAAVEAGARQVECTINGLGERAGNAALEEIVMALRTRKDYYGCDTSIDTTKLFHASQLVSRITGLSVQRNKAIVGRNAFAHEAGIHQHGMLQERSTYEIMKPEDVGYIGQNLVLGKHSGRHAFRDRVCSLGYELDDETLQEIFDDFIDLADRKKEIYDSDIVALIENRSGTSLDRWKFVSCHASSGSGSIPTATVALEDEDGKEHRDAATGGGPIEAVLHAMERVLGVSATLEDLNIRSVSKGKDALGEVSVVVRVDGKPFHGRGLSVDIIEGSALAYLNALNKADVARQQQEQREAKSV